MHRRIRKVDANQSAIVEALRAAGRSVEIISDVGRGVPDLLVGFQGWNFLLEVKATPKDQLTPLERMWHRHWRGQVAIVSSPQEAVLVTRPSGLGSRDSEPAAPPAG